MEKCIKCGEITGVATQDNQRTTYTTCPKCKKIVNLENLKEGWRVQTELKCIEDWVSIQTEYWRGNGDGVGFTYNEKKGIASDDGETEFEVGTCKDKNWIIDPRVNKIMENALIIIRTDNSDYIMLEKEIKSVDDLYAFGKALYEIDQLF